MGVRRGQRDVLRLRGASAPSPVLGIGVHVLHPGEANGMYHAEATQEGFLVLDGECLLIVEGQERRMRRWDYFHCPPDTRHVIVGAGDEPCTILMIGARRHGAAVRYPVSEVAAQHNASVARETTDPDEAYADWPDGYEPIRLPWPAA